MLDKTLVVWMGEFGRTPQDQSPRRPRPFPRAFNVALAGGGVRGGQVIGDTDAGGNEVTDRPVTVQDLFQSFCQSLKIDAAKENMSRIGRPIKIVDGGKPVDELFGRLKPTRVGSWRSFRGVFSTSPSLAASLSPIRLSSRSNMPGANSESWLRVLTRHELRRQRKPVSAHVSAVWYAPCARLHVVEPL